MDVYGVCNNVYQWKRTNMVLNGRDAFFYLTWWCFATHIPPLWIRHPWLPRSWVPVSRLFAGTLFGPNHQYFGAQEHKDLQCGPDRPLASWWYPTPNWEFPTALSWYCHSRTSEKTWSDARPSEHPRNCQGSDWPAWRHGDGRTWSICLKSCVVVFRCRLCLEKGWMQDFGKIYEGRPHLWVLQRVANLPSFRLANFCFFKAWAAFTMVGFWHVQTTHTTEPGVLQSIAGYTGSIVKTSGEKLDSSLANHTEPTLTTSHNSSLHRYQPQRSQKWSQIPVGLS